MPFAFAPSCIDIVNSMQLFVLTPTANCFECKGWVPDNELKPSQLTPTYLIGLHFSFARRFLVQFIKIPKCFSKNTLKIFV